MNKPCLLLTIFCFLTICTNAQEGGLSIFIKKEGYVKLTDTLNQAPAVKRNYHNIERIFNNNHLDKNNYYVDTRSAKIENGYLTVVIRQLDGLKELKTRKGRVIPGGVGIHDGIIIVNLKTGSGRFEGEQ